MTSGFNYIDIYLEEFLSSSLDDVKLLDDNTFKKLKNFYDNNDKPLIVKLHYKQSMFYVENVYVCTKTEIIFKEGSHHRMYFGGIRNDVINNNIGIILDTDRAGIFGSINL